MFLTKQKRSLIYLCIFILSIFITGCTASIELDINKDYSSQIRYYIPVNKLVTESQIRKEMEKTVSEFNQYAGKEGIKIEKIETKNNETEVVISMMPYKDLENVKMPDSNKDKENPQKERSEVFWGKFADYFDQMANVESDNLIMSPEHKDYISFLDIDNKDDLSIVRIFDSTFTSDLITNFRIKVDGNIKYYSDGIVLIDKNIADVSDSEDIILLYENSSNFPFIMIIITILSLLFFLGYIAYTCILKKCLDCKELSPLKSKTCTKCNSTNLNINFSFDQSRINKKIILIPIGIVILVFLIKLITIIPFSNIVSSSLDKNDIKKSLINRTISYGENDFEIKQNNIISLDIKSSEEDAAGKYISKGLLIFKSKDFNIETNIAMKHVKFASGWKLAEIKCTTFKKVPNAGPSDDTITESLKNVFSITSYKGEESLEYISIDKDNIKNIKVIDRQGNFKEGKENIKFSFSQEEEIAITTYEVTGDFIYNENDEKWELENPRINNDTILREYKDKNLTPPSDESSLKEYLNDMVCQTSGFDRVRKAIDSSKFRKFVMDSIKYSNGGQNLSYEITMDYSDEEMDYDGTASISLTYNSDSKDWDYTFTLDDDAVFQMGTEADAIIAMTKIKHEINDQEVEIKEEEILNFKIYKREDSGSDDEKVYVSFDYKTTSGETITLKYKLHYEETLLWGSGYTTDYERLD